MLLLLFRSLTRDKKTKMAATVEHDFCGLHAKVLIDDYSHVIQDNSILLIYETLFPNHMLELPSIDVSVLENLLNDSLRYFIILDYSDDTITMVKGSSAPTSLYFYVDKNNQMICCSNKVSLLRECGVPIRENKEVIPEFFVSRFVTPPNTMYEGIFQVAAGQKIKIRFGEESVKVETYSRYVPHKVQDESVRAGHFSSRFIELITENLSKIFDLDENASLLLSGGIDSSILAKIGVRLGRIKKTYSTSYPFIGSKRDTEKQYALTAAKAFEISHKHFQATTEQFLEAVIHCIAINEAPFQWSQTAMLYLLLSQSLPRESKIVISGFGADGVAGGDLFVLKSRIPFIKALSCLGLSKVCVRVLKLFKKDASIISKSMKTDFDNPENVIWGFTSYGDEDWVCRTFGVSRKDIIKGRLNAIQRAIPDLKDHSIFDIICLLDYFEGTETQTIWNNIAKSVGKTFFYPFEDRQFIETCFSIPWKIKLKEPKYIMRCIAREIKIPDFIIDRKKSGFGLAPYMDLWATPKGVFAPLIRLCREYFSDDEIGELQTCDDRKAETLWSMIMYSIWRKTMIENVSVSDIIRSLNLKN